MIGSDNVCCHTHHSILIPSLISVNKRPNDNIHVASNAHLYHFNNSKLLSSILMASLEFQPQILVIDDGCKMTFEMFYGRNL